MQSLLRARSASLNWASPSDVLREPTAIETDALFSLFSIYGIRTVVSSSSPFAEFLDTVSRLPHPPVTSVERVGSFRVAQLVASSPLVSELLTRPWGWISGNGPTMREVMQEGLRFPGLFERTFYLMTSDLPRAGLDGVVAVGEVPGRVEALLNAGLPCVQIVTAPERGHPRCDLITGSSPGEIAERLDGWFGERVGYRLRPVRRVQFRKGSLSYWARRPTRVAFGFSPLLRGYKEQSRGRWRQIPLYMTNHGLTGVLARGRIKVCFGRCPQGGQRR